MLTGHRHVRCGAQLCYRMCASIRETAKCRRLPTEKSPMATRAVNKKAKEGEQNARLLLSRGALSAIAIFRRAAFPSVRRWRCTAPYLLLAPAAPALCLSCFWRGRSPSPAFGAVFFAGRAAVIWCGANPGVRPWQDLREMRSRATGSDKISPRCVPRGLAVARFRRGAFPGINPWQVLRSMHPESGLGRENRQFVTRFARHASEMSWLWQDMRAMHPKSPANSRLGIHRAKILP